MSSSSQYKFIDLFAGCGGLEEGFLQSGNFIDVAAVEWKKPQVDTLRNRLKTKWGVSDPDRRVLHFDIQREEELFQGWNDNEFGTHEGLDSLVRESEGIDVIIGGPPCQAYSVAGRVRDENGMRNDYRNYLFEHYLSIVDRYKPNAFIFENVPGMLSASPNGIPIPKEISQGFKSIGYTITDDLKNEALINAADFGVPQNRKRVIILGLRDDIFGENNQNLISVFYKKYLNSKKSTKIYTVEDAIGDLPIITPIFDENERGARKSYLIPRSDVSWHKSRYHNLRDMNIFKKLAKDIEDETFEFTDSKALTNLYYEEIGSKSPIHRYHVLRKDEPSTTIIAHLYKDGNRYIHYDSSQARTITPREAARIQSFPDDFEFIGSQTSTFEMIGNAVPPLLGKKIADGLSEFLDDYYKEV
ncbi:DNA cytosine methyltransferase [Hutsoniella sourekii]|uniref:DNA cytosine methyltransferase n=1 Tax=Hutsoniella sourekii TaxID=87650 RepID=UPI000485D540|nr:DNA cytosine methyltransferase [Hutsoniella sourekii]